MRSTMLLLAALAVAAPAWAEGPVPADEPLAGLEEEGALGAAPLWGRRTDEDDPLAALEQGKGLTVELTQLPARSVDVQALGSGVVMNFSSGSAMAPAPSAGAPPPAPAAPPAAPSGGMFGGLFPGMNFGD